MERNLQEGDVLDLAVGIDLVKKSGAWYAYEGDKIGQGRENAKAYLTSHPEVMEELDRKVRQHYHLIEGEEEVKESDLKLTPKENRWNCRSREKNKKWSSRK